MPEPTRRDFLAAAGAAVLGAGHRAPTAEPRRPHILWLLTDEHRWDSIAAYGRHPWVQSPALDALATEGVTFTEAYCQAPLCVGSRMSFLTGRYPHHTGVYGFEYSHLETDFAVPFFTRYLHDAGYRVVGFGKEHHYRLASLTEPFTGGGRWYNLQNAFQDYDFHSWGKLDIQEADPAALRKGADRERELGILRRYLTDKKLIIGGRNPVSADETLSAHLSNRAIGYLTDQVPGDRPLFLRVSYIYPHTPILPPAPYDTLYDPRSLPLPELTDAEEAAMGVQTRQALQNLRVKGMTEAELRQMRAHYYGLCAYADREMGRVISAFKRWCGDQPWLILFTADHGCKVGEHGMHEKFTFYDESVRVPLLVASNTGRFPRGVRCDDFAELVDLAPTFLAAAGLPLPAHLEGRDLAAVVAGATPPRTDVISEKLTYGRRAMLRDRDWSFEMKVGPEDLAARRLRPEELDWARTRPLEELDLSLFDRRHDPAEVRNLAGDPAHRATCETLRQRLVERIFPADRVERNWAAEVPRLPAAP